MKEYTITKTLFKMKKKTKKHILPSESREGEIDAMESLGQFPLGMDLRDGPNDFCKHPWTLNKVTATFLFCLLWSECPLSLLSYLLHIFFLLLMKLPV